MVIVVALLLVSLVLILIGADFFTNAVEWLGKKLNLSEGAVGSVLAAVGTALPETMIPVIAILFGTGEESSHIGIGAILGAPFMLSTLAMGVTGIAAICFLHNGKRRQFMLINPIVMERDLKFFVLVYAVAIAAAFTPSSIRFIFVIFLVAAYVGYVYLTVKDNKKPEHHGAAEEGEHELGPLKFSKKSNDPALFMIVAQIIAALAVIVLGANIFVDQVTTISTTLGISAFVLSVIIAPIATELPEKFNSIIWVRQGKDTLALGNITGAMVFQSSLIPALGIALTDWALTPLAICNAVMALASGTILFCTLKFTNHLRPAVLLGVSVIYVAFIVIVVTGVIS